MAAVFYRLFSLTTISDRSVSTHLYFDRSGEIFEFYPFIPNYAFRISQNPSTSLGMTARGNAYKTKIRQPMQPPYFDFTDLPDAGPNRTLFCGRRVPPILFILLFARRVGIVAAAKLYGINVFVLFKTRAGRDELT